MIAGAGTAPGTAQAPKWTVEGRMKAEAEAFSSGGKPALRNGRGPAALGVGLRGAAEDPSYPKRKN